MEPASWGVDWDLWGPWWGGPVCPHCSLPTRDPFPAAIPIPKGKLYLQGARPWELPPGAVKSQDLGPDGCWRGPALLICGPSTLFSAISSPSGSFFRVKQALETLLPRSRVGSASQLPPTLPLVLGEPLCDSGSPLIGVRACVLPNPGTRDAHCPGCRVTWAIHCHKPSVPLNLCPPPCTWCCFQPTPLFPPPSLGSAEIPRSGAGALSAAELFLPGKPN